MRSVATHQEVSVKGPILAHPEKALATAIGLWEKLAKVLIPLIGQYDFDSLFLRSLYLNSLRQGGMGARLAIADGKSFRKLGSWLLGHPPEGRNLASVALLNTFIDLLILLTGVGLTEKVLDLAWDDIGIGNRINEFS